MLRFGETKIAKEKFYAAKKPIKIWDVNVENIVISKLAKTKSNSKYCIGYLDKAIRPLVLIMPKMSGYVKTFEVKEGDKDKNNKFISFHTDDKKLLEKYKATWTKIEDLKNIKLNASQIYDDRYRKTKIRTYSNKVYTNFRGLNVPEDDIEWKSFTVIYIDSLLAYKTNSTCKYNQTDAYKIVNDKTS